MLRRNELITVQDRALLRRWHGMLSFAVMILLDTAAVSEAFHEYDVYCAENAG